MRNRNKSLDVHEYTVGNLTGRGPGVSGVLRVQGELREDSSEMLQSGNSMQSEGMFEVRKTGFVSPIHVELQGVVCVLLSGSVSEVYRTKESLTLALAALSPLPHFAVGAFISKGMGGVIKMSSSIACFRATYQTAEAENGEKVIVLTQILDIVCRDAALVQLPRERDVAYDDTKHPQWSQFWFDTETKFNSSDNLLFAGDTMMAIIGKAGAGKTTMNKSHCLAHKKAYPETHWPVLILLGERPQGRDDWKNVYAHNIYRPRHADTAMFREIISNEYHRAIKACGRRDIQILVTVDSGSPLMHEADGASQRGGWVPSARYAIDELNALSVEFEAVTRLQTNFFIPKDGAENIIEGIVGATDLSIVVDEHHNIIMMRDRIRELLWDIESGFHASLRDPDCKMVSLLLYKEDISHNAELLPDDEEDFDDE